MGADGDREVIAGAGATTTLASEFRRTSARQLADQSGAAEIFDAPTIRQ